MLAFDFPENGFPFCGNRGLQHSSAYAVFRLANEVLLKNKGDPTCIYVCIKCVPNAVD
jgi:hypothetical protein